MFEFSSYLEQQNLKGDDALYVTKIGSSIWFCISDGAGGIAGAEQASTYIVEAFRDLTDIDNFDFPDDFESFLRKLDIELSSESSCGEATAIVGKLNGVTIVGASVGDSEAWLFNRDYDYELSYMQNLKPLLGSGGATPIGFGPIDVDKSVLLGSDGLFKYIKHEEMKSLLSAKTTAKEIAKLAKKDTGSLQDDISTIYISKKS